MEPELASSLQHFENYFLWIVILKFSYLQCIIFKVYVCSLIFNIHSNTVMVEYMQIVASLCKERMCTRKYFN